MANQLNCLRCGAGMRFMGRAKFQRRPDLLLSDLTFALAGGMEIDIYFCPKCGKIELFQPEVASDGLAQKQCPSAARCSTLTMAAARTVSTNSDSKL